ncbi:hypothetical protein LLH00_14945 [bacterium]|nr:hypothetical protein [bacterium]
MIPSMGKKIREYSPEELDWLEEILKDYWDRSRNFESESIADLEKHIWLANGAAATVSIGFIQARTTISLWQYFGPWSFISGILMLVVMKYASATNASRDRNRYQKAALKFYSNEATDDIFNSIRDNLFNYLKSSYLILQWGSGVAFIAGCIFTLIGITNK